MARYDQATSDFIEKIAGDVKPHQEEATPPTDKSLSLKPIRVAKQVLDIAKQPQKSLGKLIVRAATLGLMEKDSNVKILSVFQFLNDHYARDWWDWEPETIWHSLESDHFEGEGATPQEVKNLVMALQLCVNSMAPFEHWHIFEKVGHAFNWNPVDFAILQPLEPDEAVATMNILKRIQPKSTFEDEVLYYIAVCAKSAGMVYLPEEWTPGVQDKLNEITFEVKLKDATRKAWDSGATPVKEMDLPKDQDDLGYQVNVQLSRLEEIRQILVKEDLCA